MDRCDIDKGLTDGRQRFVVLAQPTILAQPGQSAFDLPATGSNHKTSAQAGHHLVGDIEDLLTPGLISRGLVSGVDHHAGPMGREGDAPQQSADRHLVLNVGGVHHGPDQQPQRINGNLTFASLDPFAAIIAPWPPFSVVFTDWLSTITVLGWACRPARRRTCWRKQSLIRCHTPWSVSLRKYAYTACQGGKSCGRLRQLHPVRPTYKMALSISRSGYLRGRPVRCWGNNGAICSHSLSLRSLGYGFLSFMSLSVPPFRPFLNTL